ncbi:hypothetical protein [Tautonia sociabilis]|uniref:Uncharacterized protein n=1 Tax=Tautonia sociabilis TaxID=2080755 RepID=A0A432MNK4_9BACT|nr:hypothetical protein [Tautonia sociabilis]RUL89021.1 hypothetical protein TsocGM_03940 [Tautonia sociabilis]
MSPPGPPIANGPRPRLYILFGMLSLLTFAGPLAIFLVGRGGQRPTWPPDRPIEWQVFLGVTIAFVVLFVACLVDAARLRSRPRGDRSTDRPEDAS